MNNFAQAPMSGMIPSNNGGGSGSASSLGQQQQLGGVGDGGNMGGGDNGGIQADLNQLQQMYDRQGTLGAGGDRGSQHHPIAEFLYQLTKMLTDDNSEIIEWVDGRIKVHYPERLEAEVLHKYFRHSKFASFQRQLNYFGFRKIAGKGKMSPCSYVNEAATSDIRSLLLIKRKTNGSAARKAAMSQRTMQMPQGVSHDLRANLSALAAGAAAATGNQQVNCLNSQAFNAAALFSQDAAQRAAGLGHFPLQQKSLGSNLFLNNENAMQLLMSGQKQPSAEDLIQQNGMQKTGSAPSIEQLHAQLAASLSNRQQQQQQQMGQNGGQMNNMGLASNALNQMNQYNNQQQNNNNNGSAGGPASAAMNATAALNNLQQQQNNQGGGGGPATAAMSAASAGASNFFDSAANLKSLVGDQQGSGAAAPGGAGAPGSSLASQQFLNRGLSSIGTFPDGNLSTASFGNLLASNNRLSSLLSLNSFLSRDPSTADLLGGMNMLNNPSAAQQQLGASQASNAAAGLQGNNMQRFS